MAETPEDDDSKEFDPSQRRLQQAREDGDVVRSDDLQSAAAQAGFLVALLAAGGWVVAQAGAAGQAFLARADRFSLTDRAGEGVWPGLVAMSGPPMALLLVPALAVVAWLVASQSFVVAPSKLEFKWDRLSPLANARQKFGGIGLVDFAKRGIKMLAIAALLVFYLRAQVEDLYQAARLDAGQVALLLAQTIVGFLALGVVLSLVFGAADYLIQRAAFLRRHRMTRKEMTDELKESEGDPHVKADRRRRAQEIATRRMLTDVPTADVVIVNPTHYAVALRWDRDKRRAPVCVAKGVDEIAARIRERAAEAGVPIRRDPPTARLLYAALDLGEEIRPEHYAAVAAAIRFADAMRRRARKTWRKP